MANLPAIKLTLSRERVTRVVSPSEAGYIRFMRGQMEGIMANMTNVVAHIQNVTAHAIVFGLEPAFKRSQELVPVDTGDLKRSGFLEVRPRKSGVDAAIGYGRFGQPSYAAMVHERLDFRHAPPTQAKFLETAINEHIGDFQRRVELFMTRESGAK
jgi:hypothetical protein